MVARLQLHVTETVIDKQMSSCRLSQTYPKYILGKIDSKGES